MPTKIESSTATPSKKAETHHDIQPRIIMRANNNYHNAQITGGVGIHWNMGEEREVTWEQYQQLIRDKANVFTRVK